MCPRGLAASHKQHMDGASLSPQHLRDPHGLGLGHERGDSTETGLREVDGGGGMTREHPLGWQRCGAGTDPGDAWGGCWAGAAPLVLVEHPSLVSVLPLHTPSTPGSWRLTQGHLQHPHPTSLST